MNTNLESQFEELLETIDLSLSFALIPVEVPSRAEGEALAQWLDQQGRRVKLLAPNDVTGHEGLTRRLLSLTRSDADVIIVLGDDEKLDIFQKELAPLNWARDRLGKQFPGPLLWCGTAAFLNETWTHAPDFWSVALLGTVLRPRPLTAPDIAILIALPEEFQTLARELEPTWISRPNEKYHGYDYFFTGPNGYRCVATIMSRMGPTDSNTHTQRLLDYNPMLMVNIGIAGSLKDDDLQIADVLVPAEVAAYADTGKMNGPTWEHRGVNFRPTAGLVAEVQHFPLAHRKAYQQWVADGREDLAKLLPKEAERAAAEALMEQDVLRREPIVSTKHLASGPFVIVGKPFADWIRYTNADIFAGEMEAAGLLSAVESRRAPYQSLVIRGISDHVAVDKAKLDKIGKGALRGLAMRNAWRFLKTLMQVGVLPRVQPQESKASETASKLNIPRSFKPTPTFVGQEEEKKKLEAAFATGSTVAITAVHGMPGVGKTFLASHFAATHAKQFPDGVVLLALAPDEKRSVEQLDEALAHELSPDLDRRRLPQVLATRSLLLLVENVDSKDHVALVTKFLAAGRLPVRAIVTGRVNGIGKSLGWEQVPLDRMSEADALKLFEAWNVPRNNANDAEVLKRLATKLDHLPLALALAAGYIEAGGTAEVFLQALTATGLDVKPQDLAETADLGERARRVLKSSFAISMDFAERGIGADGCAALEVMGAVLRQEFGLDVAAAVAGRAAWEFVHVVQVATHLSLLDTVKISPTAPRFRFHPLMAEYLSGRCKDVAAGWERLRGWFEPRMLVADQIDPSDRERLQAQVLGEWSTLRDWLARMPETMAVDISARLWQWGRGNGPLLDWAHIHERAARAVQPGLARATALYRQSTMLRLAGDLDGSLKCAEAMALEAGEAFPREWAVARGLVADIHIIRGQFDEALRIRREEQLPVYERLRDARLRAVTAGQVADILQLRGELDDALRILQNEVIPVFSTLRDAREHALAQDKVATIRAARGELDEALRIRREEELPVYERLGDQRLCAITLVKIADILQKRGQLEEALRIYREDALPMFERVGAARDHAVTSNKIAEMLVARGDLEEAIAIFRNDVLPFYDQIGNTRILAIQRANLARALLARNNPGDVPEAQRLLYLALDAARGMRIPEAEQIAEILQEHGWDPDAERRG